MHPIIEFRNNRLNKAKKLRDMGINPYPSKSSRTHYSRTIIDNYEKHEGSTVTIAGRLTSFRKHGGLSFGHVQDQTGKIQLYIRKDLLTGGDSVSGGLGYPDLKLLDVGDFVEATGIVTKTQQGEISVQPHSIRLLTKALRPLPDKWSGLKDREAILRRRYLDTTMNSKQKEPFEAISRMLYAIRAFLNERGFVEFLTPVLQPVYGGGTAKPFTTHVNALNCNVYLSISHELYLKRLIAAGFDKVYTIGRYFRNEGIDRSHHPEFSMLETMTAYENFEYNMNLIEDLFRYIAQEVFGKTVFNVRGHMIDFGAPWKRISMADAILEVTGIDFRNCKTVDEANSFLHSLGIDEPQDDLGLAMHKVFEERIEETLIAPTLVFGHPIEISPLAKPMESDARFAERFEIYIGGMECGDNWSEQNDPVELLSRWKDKYKMKELDPEEFHPLDYDFIEMLEYGIPPTTGVGPGIERMAMLFTEQDNIDDVIFFPLMKPVLSDENTEIYNIEELPDISHEGEDILLTIDELEEFITEDIFYPETTQIIVRPYLRKWKRAGLDKHWRASGHIEIEGFVKDTKLRVVGYKVKAEDELNEEEEKNRFKDLVELSLPSTITKYSDRYEIVIKDVVTLKAPSK